MKKLYLDTNIILDFLGERHPYYNPTAHILTLADQKKIQLFTSAASISTVYYLLLKYDTRSSALDKIRKFKVLCGISPMNEEEVHKAINSDFSDFEDAFQYFSAIKSNCDFLITRNEKDFKSALIPILDAEGFSTYYKEISS